MGGTIFPEAETGSKDLFLSITFDSSLHVINLLVLDALTHAT